MLLLSFWVSLGNSRLELCPWGCSLCPSGSGVPLRLMPHEMLLIWLTPIPFRPHPALPSSTAPSSVQVDFAQWIGVPGNSHANLVGARAVITVDAVPLGSLWFHCMEVPAGFLHLVSAPTPRAELSSGQEPGTGRDKECFILESESLGPLC